MDEAADKGDRLAALERAFFASDSNPSEWLTGWHPEMVKLQRDARKRTDQSSWWNSGVAPILDVVGLEDPFRPASERNFYTNEFRGRVTLKTVAKASHALPHEKPEEVAALVSQWIAQIETKRGSLT